MAGTTAIGLEGHLYHAASVDADRRQDPTCASGWYYWFPKMTGYMYSESLGKLHFWLMFIGANIAFFPMHFLGLAGMPRRIADYPEAFAGWNFVASIGSYISFAGLLVFFLGLAYAFAR